MRTTALVVLAVLAVALAGCAGAPAGAGPVDTAHVTMPPSYRFDPPVIRVRAGTTVTWTNQDHFTHSVAFTQGGLPVLNLKPGETGSISFTQPGEYRYTCSYHPHDMSGTVIVTAP